jgi:GNAT superfamily N-acetyltransferase
VLQKRASQVLGSIHLRENMNCVNHSAASLRPELLIRSIQACDAEQVAVLAEQLGYQRSADDITAWIEALSMHAGDRAAFVACIADAIVGWIEVSVQHHLQSAPHALIGGLVVKDGYRNRQIGLLLCQHAEAWAWERGLPIVRVTSRSTRLDAHRFYDRNGYTLTKLSHVYEKHQPK